MGQPSTSTNHFSSGRGVSKLKQSFRIGCDADGWMILPNKEPSYPHYFHALSPTDISSVKVTGDVEIGYIGFGSKGLQNHIMPNTLKCSVSIIAKIFISHNHHICKMENTFSTTDLQPAPPVGFNLTFVCPEGEVKNTFFPPPQPTAGVQPRLVCHSICAHHLPA